MGPGGAYKARTLVGVEERCAEEEHGAEDERGEERGDTGGLLALALEEEAEHERRQDEDDRERGERAERVDVVDGPEPSRACEACAHAGALHDRDGHGEAEERQPRERGQEEQRH